MALPSIFKRRKLEAKKGEKEKEAPEKKQVSDKREPKEAKKKARAKKTSGIAPKVLISPIITEKTTELSLNNQYVFLVPKETGKIEIKKAIKDLYGTDAEKVNIINIPRKRKTIGRTPGWKKGYKKAVVKLKKGQKIDLTPA